MLVNVTRPFRFRGVQRLTWLLAKVLPATAAVRVELSPDRAIQIRLLDGYWMKLLHPEYRYEPEIEYFLDNAIDECTVFIDCGANIGYWTVCFGSRASQCVAIEANPTVFEQLRANLSLNGLSVLALNAAVWERSTSAMDFVSDRLLHAGGGLLAAQGDQPGKAEWSRTKVRTVTLAQVIDEMNVPYGTRIIVKVDVEGAEVPVILSTAPLSERYDLTFVFEDHGSDKSSRTTSSLLDRGYRVFDLVTGQSLTADEVSDVKSESWRGYNFGARHAASLGSRNAEDEGRRRNE